MSKIFKVETIGMVATLILIVFYKRALFWDENYYYENVLNFLNPAIDHITFIRDLKGPAGPVYTYFHAVFYFATKGDGLFVRLLNFLFIVFGLYLSDLFKNNERYFNRKLLLLPSFYPILGLALTEAVPLIASFFIVLRLKRINDITSSVKLILFILLISLSILGRQQYLVIPIGLILHQLMESILLNKGFERRQIIIAVSALLIPLIYFTIWGGIQPPSTSFVENGLSVEHFSLALFVAAMFDVIISEGLVRIVWNATVGILFASIVLLQLLFVGDYDLVPFHELTLDTHLELLHRLVWMILLLIVSSYYLSVKIHEYFGNINKGNMRSLFVMIYLGFLLTNIKINHLFAARYVVPAIVFLLALKEENNQVQTRQYDLVLLKTDLAKIIFKYAIVIVGLLHLISYYNYD